MKKLDVQDPKVRVLVCTNERPVGKACCKKAGGQAFFEKLKTRLKGENFYSTHKATRTGCLGYCNDAGCTLIIQSEGMPSKWYTEVTDADFDTIWRETTQGT